MRYLSGLLLLAIGLVAALVSLEAMQVSKTSLFKLELIVTLLIFNIIGEKVFTLVQGYQRAGEHRTVWNASAFSLGIYFARLEANGESQSVRMVLLK